MSAAPANTISYQDWVGKTETRTDRVAPLAVAALAATLDRADPPPQPGDPLPPLWHWLYFWDVRRAGELGRDGHPQRGGFLPPVPLPRRMWAGGQLYWRESPPLRVGEEITRVSRIANVEEKSGRSGPLAFVSVHHTIADAAGYVAVAEQHDIVYREDPRPGQTPAPPQLAPTEAAWTREIQPDPVLLFRYSALTFNGHRIHYDPRYATEVEGYAGLVVHGPLVATLLLDLLRRERPADTVASYKFRSVRPACVTADGAARLTLRGQPDPVEGKTIRLWASDAAGALIQQGTATLA